MSKKKNGEEKIYPLDPLVNEEMRKIWNLIKHRMSTEKLWEIAKIHSKNSLGSWALDEIMERKKKN